MKKCIAVDFLHTVHGICQACEIVNKISFTRKFINMPQVFSPGYNIYSFFFLSLFPKVIPLLRHARTRAGNAATTPFHIVSEGKTAVQVHLRRKSFWILYCNCPRGLLLHHICMTSEETSQTFATLYHHSTLDPDYWTEYMAICDYWRPHILKKYLTLKFYSFRKAIFTRKIMRCSNMERITS